ncbi:MAG TPA: hypothetical protein VM285_02490, partial [Polyangia bacterium]|nr:hypothetical protein [Polyangia bacterium]
ASQAALEDFRNAAGVVGQALDESGNTSTALTGEQRQKVLAAAGPGGKGSPAAVAAVAEDDLGIDVDIDVESAVQTSGQVADGSDLFSLGNLQSLTRDAPAAAPIRGKAGEEISGLVDLRALTQLREDENQLEISELLHLGHGGSAGIAPVVAPETVERRRNWLIGIGAGLAAVIVLGGLIFVLVRQAGKDAAAEEESDKAVAMLMEEIEKLKTSGASAEELKKAEEALADEQARQAGHAGDGEPVALAKAEGGKSGGSKDKKSGGSAKASTAGAAPAPAAPRPKGGSVSELDDLLGGGGSKPAKKPAATGGGVPDKLSRDEVQDGMQSVARAVKACGKGAGGTITIRVTIAASGSVTSAKATGPHAGTPVGSCAEKAVKKARFSKAKNKLDVSYPFKL